MRAHLSRCKQTRVLGTSRCTDRYIRHMQTSAPIVWRTFPRIYYKGGPSQPQFNFKTSALFYPCHNNNACLNSLLNDKKVSRSVFLRKEYINKTTAYMLISMFIQIHIPTTRQTKGIHASGHFIMVGFACPCIQQSWLPSIGSDCNWLSSVNLNGVFGAKLAAGTDSLSISTGLKYREENVTWVTPDKSRVWFTVRKDRQICPLSPFENPWIGRHIFDLVASRITAKLYAFICSGDEKMNCVFSPVVLGFYFLWWRVGELSLYLLWWRIAELGSYLLWWQ